MKPTSTTLSGPTGLEKNRLVRAGTQTATFWVDEAGSRSTAGTCYVMAAVKTRHPDKLQRAITSIRQRHDNYDGEFKFSRIQSGNVDRFLEMVEVLEHSEAKIAATVIDGTVYNPFKGASDWQAHADVISRLVVGNLNKNEIATVAMDTISTPADYAMGTAVKGLVNTQLRGTSVTAAFSLDSRCSDLLQAADLVAGAVFYQRRRDHRRDQHETAKLRVSRQLATAFGVSDLSDHRSGRVNIATLARPRRAPQRRPELEIVRQRRPAN